jgi:hypothetical protein
MAAGYPSGYYPPNSPDGHGAAAPLFLPTHVGVPVSPVPLFDMLGWVLASCDLTANGTCWEWRPCQASWWETLLVS